MLVVSVSRMPADVEVAMFIAWTGTGAAVVHLMIVAVVCAMYVCACAAVEYASIITVNVVVARLNFVVATFVISSSLHVMLVVLRKSATITADAGVKARFIVSGKPSERPGATDVSFRDVLEAGIVVLVEIKRRARRPCAADGAMLIVVF
jgi:hypothetical protein